MELNFRLCPAEGYPASALCLNVKARIFMSAAISLRQEQSQPIASRFGTELTGSRSAPGSVVAPDNFAFPEVLCLAFQGSDVYAGGNFVSAGGVSASYVARYDGNTWNALRSTINGPVSALIFYNGNLYAGGAFTNVIAGITNLARWDGNSWSAAGGNGPNRQVTDFATDGSNLFVGGMFTQIGGIAADGIAKFDGNSWSALGSGVKGLQGVITGQVNKMAWQSNQLYVVGSFERAGNAGASYVARWDGTNWWGLGGQTSKGMDYNINAVSCLLAVSNQLYAGGEFTAAGNLIVNEIGLWDGTNWSALGDGVSRSFTSGSTAIVRGLAMIGTNLFAGGSFTNASGVTVNGIARWDGSNWWALGSGVDSTIRALIVANGTNLYAGGSFTNAGGIPSRGVAMWDGNSWHGLNGGMSGSSGIINAFAYDGALAVYAGGIFTNAGGVAASNIAMWNGSVWSSLGTGLNGLVGAIVYTNGLLYVGGAFTIAGGVSANHIAVWNGTTWSSLGTGVTGNSQAFVANILVRGNNIYVTGNFINAGGIFATNIAKWDGSQWSALGSGLVQPSGQNAMGLTSINNDLYVSGVFTFAGDKPSQYIAHWNDQLNFYPPPHPQLTRNVWLNNQLFQFRLIGTSGESYILQGSTDLSVWTPLLTNSATLYDYTDPNASLFPVRFYRAVLGP